MVPFVLTIYENLACIYSVFNVKVDNRHAQSDTRTNTQETRTITNLLNFHDTRTIMIKKKKQTNDSTIFNKQN